MVAAFAGNESCGAEGVVVADGGSPKPVLSTGVVPDVIGFALLRLSVPAPLTFTQ